VTILGAVQGEQKKIRSMERDVELYFDRLSFESHICGIVLHPLKDGQKPSDYEHPQSLDSGIIDEYLSDTTITPQSVHKEAHYLEDISDHLLTLLEREEAPDECVEIIENVMVMADSIDQSLQTLRSQLNLVTFNLRSETPSEEKYENILEMLRNLQYLRITVNRPTSSVTPPVEDVVKVTTQDATTQVQPKQKNASVACSLSKESSPMKSLLKSVKKNVDPEHLRKSSKSVISSASSKLELMAPATPKRLRSFGKGTKKAFTNLKQKMDLQK